MSMTLVIIGAAIGASLGVAVAPPMTKRLAWVSIFSGIVMGGTISPLACWYLNIPLDLAGYVGCIIGLPGVGVAAFIILVARDPIGTWERIKGKRNE